MFENFVHHDDSVARDHSDEASGAILSSLGTFNLTGVIADEIDISTPIRACLRSMFDKLKRNRYLYTDSHLECYMSIKTLNLCLIVEAMFYVRSVSEFVIGKRFSLSDLNLRLRKWRLFGFSLLHSIASRYFDRRLYELQNRKGGHVTRRLAHT